MAARNDLRAWTSDEERELIRLFPTHSTKELARLLKRGEHSIEQKAYKLRVRVELKRGDARNRKYANGGRKRSIAPETIAAMRELRLAKFRPEFIARTFGVSESSVRRLT